MGPGACRMRCCPPPPIEPTLQTRTNSSQGPQGSHACTCPRKRLSIAASRNAPQSQSRETSYRRSQVSTLHTQIQPCHSPHLHCAHTVEFTPLSLERTPRLSEPGSLGMRAEHWNDFGTSSSPTSRPPQSWTLSFNTCQTGHATCKTHGRTSTTPHDVIPASARAQGGHHLQGNVSHGSDRHASARGGLPGWRHQDDQIHPIFRRSRPIPSPGRPRLEGCLPERVRTPHVAMSRAIRPRPSHSILQMVYGSAEHRMHHDGSNGGHSHQIKGVHSRHAVLRPPSNPSHGASSRKPTAC